MATNMHVTVTRQKDKVASTLMFTEYHYARNFRNPWTSNLAQLASHWPTDVVGRLCYKLEERTTRAMNFIHDINFGCDISKDEYPSVIWSRMELTTEQGNALTLALMMFESALHWNSAPSDLVQFVKERKTLNDNLAKFLSKFEEVVAILSELGTLINTEKSLACTCLATTFPSSLRVPNKDFEQLINYDYFSKSEITWKDIHNAINFYKAQDSKNAARIYKVQQSLDVISDTVIDYAEDVVSIPYGRDSKGSNFVDIQLFDIFLHYSL
ncbi:hypothetical protein CHUAL_010961 [Chamberlinius hualienensis]